MINEKTTGWRNWLPQLAALMWIVLLTTASYNRYMFDGQHADVLINTVMSQQHLSLFYWGQNRLLNLLPFLTSLVSNIPANVFLVTWLPGAFLAGLCCGPAVLRSPRLI